MKYSMQEAFSVCYQHVIKQGEPGYVIEPGQVGGYCTYNFNGKQCAIGGPLVAAGQYVPAMEEKGVRILFIDHAARMEGAGFGKEHINLLMELQNAHDTSAGQSMIENEDGFTPDFMSFFQEMAMDVAEKFGLECK